MALGKRAWRWRKRAWRGAIVKVARGNTSLSAPALELNTIIFKHVYWYMQLISGERLQDHWSSGLKELDICLIKLNKHWKWHKIF